MVSAAAAGVAASSFARLDSVLEGLRRRSVTAEQVYKDWRLLRILWESCQKGSDAGLKIEAAAEEIAQDLSHFSNGEQEDNEGPESQFLLQLVRDCESKTKRLMAEIGEALDYLYSSCSTGGGSTISSCLQFQLMSPATLDVSFWPRLVSHVQSSVLRISQIAVDHLGHEHFGVRDRVFTFYNSLKSIKRYFGLFLSNPKFPSLVVTGAGAGAGATTEDGLPRIDACFGHVVSLVLRIANRCSDNWLECKTGRIQVEQSELSKFVEDLHHEIHPRNPNFMRFHLNFLLALFCSSNNKDEKMDIIMQFCNYLFNSERGDFRKEVSSLVTLFVDAITKLKDKDVEQNFFPEINAALVEMASLFEAHSRKGHKLGDSPQCSKLLVRICLLRVELSLMVQIRNMNNTSSNSLASSTSMLSDWKEIPKNLSLYSENLPLEKTDDGKKKLAFIEPLLQEVESLHQSFEQKKITGSLVKNSLLILFLKVVIFKEEWYLKELLLVKNGKNAISMTSGKDQIAFHLQKLEYFPLILSDGRMKDREDMFRAFKPIDIFFRRLTCSACSFLIAQDEMVHSFSELLEKVNHLTKAELKEIIPPFPLFDFPKAFKQNFLDSLLENLRELLKHDPNAIASVKHHITEIHVHLESLRSFLAIEEVPELKDIGNHIINLAYRAEYLIDSIEVDARWQDFFWLSDVLEELRHVKEEACGIYLAIRDAKTQVSKNVTQISVDKILMHTFTPAVREFIVNLRDEEEYIIHQLTRGSKHLDIVSIVGMPGLGKTTLARKVYNTRGIMRYFHVRAWCTVSKVYEKRELVFEILTGIHGLTDEIRQMSNEDLELELRDCLQRKRYLIVMDDVWDVKAWKYMKDLFPDDANGSRILLTCRLRDVALRINSHSDPHSLRLLSNEESWRLLEKKVFNENNCPQELVKTGKEIAVQCTGFPLAIVALAGLLRMTELSIDSWRNVAEALLPHILSDPQTKAYDVLELSYKHLPENLKPCFLYLGVLEEDKDVLVSKLIQFWLAEGLIPKTEAKSLEYVAEEFLMELINRGLVIMSKRRSNGRVKACRPQPLIIDFCKEKIKEENFFQLETGYSEPFASFPSSGYGFEFDFFHQTGPLQFASYRLAMFLNRNHFVQSRPSGRGTRSLVFFASKDSEPRWPYDISSILRNFKLLRVLDFECINIVSLPVEIAMLIQLRYLAVGGYLTSIPQSIANLRKLQTLIVKGLRGKIILPNTIWRMTSLRHLHVSIHVIFDSDDEEELEDCFVLENLVSFSRLSLPCGKDSEWTVKRFPNLRKLSCIFFQTKDSSANHNQFPRLNLLCHLESLKIFCYGSCLSNGMFNLPLTLKKLTLSDFCLPWSRISAIGRLPNLEILKLRSDAFVGPRWDMMEEEFHRLTFLSLDTLDIVQWNACCDHFPRLEKLVLQNCKCLEEIPMGLAEIPTLGVIEVNCCSLSVEESAMTLREEIGDIEVIIRSSYLSS